MEDRPLRADVGEWELERLWGVALAVDRDDGRVGAALSHIHERLALGQELHERAAPERGDLLPEGRELPHQVTGRLVAPGPGHGAPVVRIASSRQRDLGAVIEDGRARHGEEIDERLSQPGLRVVRHRRPDEARHVVVVDERRAGRLAAG